MWPFKKKPPHTFDVWMTRDYELYVIANQIVNLANGYPPQRLTFKNFPTREDAEAHLFLHFDKIITLDNRIRTSTKGPAQIYIIAEKVREYFREH